VAAVSAAEATSAVANMGLLSKVFMLAGHSSL
jgi:hypothetical protein